jgi:hypothetical protein
LVIGVVVLSVRVKGERDRAVDLLTAAGVLRGATLGADKGALTK